jgi:8-oxo-dGTP pyrophosphatase MutT (NUDIX family)
MLKIFSAHKIIYLIDNQKKYTSNKGSLLVNVNSKREVRSIYEELMHKDSLEEIYFLHADLNQLKDYFFSMFKLIEAAGGLVKNNKEEWLFIFRNGKWDLPKGKVEKKEALKDAAIREVEEECGIGKLKIIKELPSTYHTYFMEEKPVLKCTYWYLMTSDDSTALVPQIEEGITDVKWLSMNDIKQVLRNTYESIKDVLMEINTSL